MKINILCKFFGHSGKWKYVADNSCEQVRVCKRDGYQENRTNHQMSFHTSSYEEEVKVPHRQGGGYIGVIHETRTYECNRCGIIEDKEENVKQMRGNYNPS